MKRILAGLCLLASLGAAGCTTWNGSRQAEYQVKKLLLEGNNYRILKSGLQAAASCKYVFPSAGLSVAGITIVPTTSKMMHRRCGTVSPKRAPR